MNIEVFLLEFMSLITLLILFICVVDDPKRTEHLLNLDGAKERLHLFKANLVEEGSFDPVVDGCESVFHVASPVLLGTNIDPPVIF